MSARKDTNQEANRINKKRIAYALAAGAAVTSANNEAQGAIVYSGIANFAIDQGYSRTLRFDTDTYDDVLLKNFVFGGVNYHALTVSYAPGKVIGFNPFGTTPFRNYVTALTEGFMIDSSSVGPTFYGTLAFEENNPNAQFKNAEGAFIGMSFPVGPTDLYYAWIRVNIDNEAGTFTIVDWAWEDQVGVGIAAGDTGLIPGDLNFDGEVTGRDFLAWQRGETDPAFSVDSLIEWQDNYNGGALVGLNAVPEPMTLGLLAAGASGLVLMRRLRQRLDFHGN